MNKGKHSAHVNVNYTVESKKTGIRTYREDTFIFPCVDEAKIRLYLQHIQQIIHRERDAYMYVVRLTETERRNRHGATECDKTNCRMFRKIADGVMESIMWNDTEEIYCDCTEIMTVKNAIKALGDEIMLQMDWIDI